MRSLFTLSRCEYVVNVNLIQTQFHMKLDNMLAHELYDIWHYKQNAIRVNSLSESFIVAIGDGLYLLSPQNILEVMINFGFQVEF